MKNVVADHLERWFWHWLIMGIGYLVVGTLYLHDGRFPGATIMMFLLWTGVYQLNHDLLQRHLVAVATLPLTLKQMGRAWWLISVGLPALLLAVTSGAGICALNYFEHSRFPTRLFIENSAINTCFLAVFFLVLIALPNRRPQGAREYFEVIGLGGVAGYFVIEMLRLRDLKTDSREMIIFLVAGAIFTMGSWFSAEQLAVRRMGFEISRAQTRKEEIPRHSPITFGGVPFLVAARIFQTTLIILGINAFLCVVILAEGRPFDFDALVFFNPFFLCFLIFLQLVPFLKQMRLFRTLPISTTKMAVFAVALPLLLCLTAAIWATAIAIPIEGVTKSLENPATYIVDGAYLTLCVPFLLVLGCNQIAVMAVYVSNALGITMFQIEIMPKTPQSFLLIVSGMVIVLSFFLTKKCLENSDDAYKIWPNPLGIGWN